AALGLMEPVSNGVGGDLFAIVWDAKTHKLYGYNGSGRSPKSLTMQYFVEHGIKEIPPLGPLPVNVPGCVDAWFALHDRFGKLPIKDDLAPAIRYAREGFPVTELIAYYWKLSAPRLSRFPGFKEQMTLDGRAPEKGEIWKNPNLAATLETIANQGRDAFYKGRIAHVIGDYVKANGGFLAYEDLAAHHGEWVEPISTNYRGYDVWELPPNGQGLAALIALNILEGFDLAQYPRESVESYHLQIEAMKLAFVEALRYIADPERVNVPVRELLSKKFAARRRALIGEQALLPETSEKLSGDTVYLCAADADGMMVSLIQSNADVFGSHVAVPGTGMVLQNRASAFSLDPAHPNCLEPGKRPFHTIIPGFLTHNGQAISPFGVMGGHMQPQGHLQMIVNTLDYGLDPQASLDAPRWFWGEDRWVQVEPTVAPAIVEALRERGHEMNVDDEVDFVGRGQIIWRLPSGVYIAGSEPRADGS